MTVKEALSKWSDACTVCQAKEQYIRDGNWQTIARALRHFTKEGAASVDVAGDLNGDTVIEVTPAAPSDESKPRPPFLLVVK